jgi:hypothetical protein
MASHFDDFDRKKLDETLRFVHLLVEQVAQLQVRLDKMILQKENSAWGRKYLRRILTNQKVKLKEQAGYIAELENELRLRGLE